MVPGPIRGIQRDRVPETLYPGRYTSLNQAGESPEDGQSLSNVSPFKGLDSISQL